MFELILTLDYELPVNTRPDVMDYIIKPTEALLDVCNAFGVKLTVMVEIGELWAFEKAENIGFTEYLGYDAAAKIRKQLVQAVNLGHDVQLHLHPQWLNAKWEQDAWQLDYSKYRLTDLDYHEMVDVFRGAKEYLESLLCPYCDDYSCIGFRAGNWNTQPSSKYLRALYEAGLKSDTSVFKWGYLNTASVYMDYRNAHSNVLPWVASWDDINSPSKDEGVLEFPIYAEPVSMLGMLTLKRLRLAISYLREDKMIARAVNASVLRPKRPREGLSKKMRRIFGTYPKKLDFCKLTPREMIRMLLKVRHRFNADTEVSHVPIVMIGHSKDTRTFEELSMFLYQVDRRFGDSLRFCTYREIIKAFSDDYYQSFDH